MSGDRCNAGTTLVELLVVLALVGIMVVAAAELVSHSIALLGATGRAVGNPVMVTVTERIRRDIQEAASLEHVETVWSEAPLVLRSRSGSVIRYSRSGGDLLRESLESGGEPDSRVVLRGVTSWWWRSTAPSLVDVNIGHLVHVPPEYRRSQAVGYERERRIENLRFAIRGGWSGASW